MSQKTASKTVTFTPEFSRASLSNPNEALAYMLMAAFGVTLGQCMAAVDKMIADNDVPVMVFCLTAAVQIRGNTVFVGSQFGNVRIKYPILVIDGSREVKDTFNYGACHICGHILAEIGSEPLAAAILAKAGSCVRGTGLKENDAGKINTEIFKSFSIEDHRAFGDWLDEKDATQQQIVNQVLVAVPRMASTFSGMINKQPSTAPVVIASKAPSLGEGGH